MTLPWFNNCWQITASTMSKIGSRLDRITRRPVLHEWGSKPETKRLHVLLSKCTSQTRVHKKQLQNYKSISFPKRSFMYLREHQYGEQGTCVYRRPLARHWPVLVKYHPRRAKQLSICTANTVATTQEGKLRMVITNAMQVEPARALLLTNASAKLAICLVAPDLLEHQAERRSARLQRMLRKPQDQIYRRATQ
jgi:hypothetical protein